MRYQMLTWAFSRFIASFFYFFLQTAEVGLSLNKHSKARKVLEDLYRDNTAGEYADNAIFLIGESFYKEGMYKEAEICFTGILKKHPFSEIKDYAVYRLGWSQLSDDRWDEAANTFKSVDKQSPLYTPSLNLTKEIMSEKKE